jgi:hypothetical protein
MQTVTFKLMHTITHKSNQTCIIQKFHNEFAMNWVQQELGVSN